MVSKRARLLPPRRVREAVRLREFLAFLSVPLLLMAIGTAGYMRIEHWRPLESLYMTVITITTVGFNEVHPLSGAGRVFTIALLLVGVFTLFYAATAAIRAIAARHMRRVTGAIVALIWKDPASIRQVPPVFVRTVSPRPAHRAIRARASSGSSQLIGRATTTMNHSDIRGSEPHDHDSSGAASV